MDDEHAAMAAWIRDAREQGLPAMVTGLVVLMLCGWPFWLAAMGVGLLGIVLLVWGASVTFPAPDTERPDC